MLNLHQAIAPVVLLISLGITGAIANTISPSRPEPLPSPDIVQSPNALDTHIPDAVKQQYREDAAQLALRVLLQEPSAASEEIELPPELVQEFYDLLIQVYLAKDLPERDTVINTYNIYTFRSYSTREVIVEIDPTKAWTQAWQRGERMTGNAEIDALIEGYNLELENYLSGLKIAVLQADRPLNTPALARVLSRIEGIETAAASSLGGDGSDIYAERKDGYWQLDYSVGKGDCPAGCTQRTAWRFHVYPDSRVQFVERLENPPRRRINLPSGVEGRATSSTYPGNIRRLPDGTEAPVKPLISPAPRPIAVLDSTGREVTRIQPDKDGYFRATLPPGTYTLAPEVAESEFLVLGNRNYRFTVTVTKEQFTPADIEYTIMAP